MLPQKRGDGKAASPLRYRCKEIVSMTQPETWPRLLCLVSHSPANATQANCILCLGENLHCTH